MLAMLVICLRTRSFCRVSVVGLIELKQTECGTCIAKPSPLSILKKRRQSATQESTKQLEALQTCFTWAANLLHGKRNGEPSAVVVFGLWWTNAVHNHCMFQDIKPSFGMMCRQLCWPMH